jgi:hypothetical protein
MSRAVVWRESNNFHVRASIFTRMTSLEKVHSLSIDTRLFWSIETLRKVQANIVASKLINASMFNATMFGENLLWHNVNRKN